MGMYDYIRCEVPLPDGWGGESGGHFQTKDFDCEMVTHVITKDGRLMLSRIDRVEEVPKAERRYPDAPDDSLLALCGCIRTHTSLHDSNYHGVVNFYGLETTGHEPDERYPGGSRPIYKSHEYNAKFTDGQLVKIELDPDSD